MSDDKHRRKSNPSLPNPSRRRFLKGVGAVGAGAALVDKLALRSNAEADAASPTAAPSGAKVRVPLDINGQKRQATVESRTTLLSAMRDHLEPAVTGPKLVCDHGTCGACTVLLEGKPVYSCLVLAVAAANRKITTVEGLVSSHLKANPNSTLDQIRRGCHGNFCRCGTYPKIFEAAMAAAKGSQHATMQTIHDLVKGT